jgi:hypothetical protein
VRRRSNRLRATLNDCLSFDRRSVINLVCCAYCLIGRRSWHSRLMSLSESLVSQRSAK